MKTIKNIKSEKPLIFEMNRLGSTMKKIAFFLFIIITTIYFFGKDYFFINNATKKADAILILSGNPQTRIEKAIELYKKGYAKEIFITSCKEIPTKYPSIFPTQIEISKKIFHIENISNYKVIPSNKGGATSTFDEAYDLARYTKIHPLKRVIIVTDGFHTGRALYAFEKIFKKFHLNTKFEAASTSNLPKDWYKDEKLLSSYLLEPIKFLVYIFRDSNLPYIKER